MAKHEKKDPVEPTASDATDDQTMTAVAPKGNTPKRPQPQRKSESSPDQGPDENDLFDKVEPLVAKTKARLSGNMLNIGVVAALLFLIIMANWITQPKDRTAKPVSDSVVDTVAEPAAQPAPEAVAVVDVADGALGEVPAEDVAQPKPAEAPQDVAAAEPIRSNTPASISASLNPGATTTAPAAEVETYQPRGDEMHREYLHQLDGPSARRQYQEENQKRTVRKVHRRYVMHASNSGPDQVMLSYYDRVAVGQQNPQPKSAYAPSPTSPPLVTERRHMQHREQVQEDFQQDDTFDIRY